MKGSEQQAAMLDRSGSGSHKDVKFCTLKQYIKDKIVSKSLSSLCSSVQINIKFILNSYSILYKLCIIV